MRLALPFDDHYGGRVVDAKGGVNEEAVRGAVRHGSIGPRI